MPQGIASAFAQQPARCEVDKARFFVGEPYSRELAERAGRAAGARSTRKLEPGMPATTDLREDRLNLQVEARYLRMKAVLSASPNYGRHGLVVVRLTLFSLSLLGAAAASDQATDERKG